MGWLARPGKNPVCGVPSGRSRDLGHADLSRRRRSCGSSPSRHWCYPWSGNVASHSLCGLPEERQRVCEVPTFGLPGPDLDSFLEYQRTSREYMRDIWRASHFPDSVVEEAAAVGLRVIRPEPYYGRSDERGPQMQS
jgi:hypothetical protein